MKRLELHPLVHKDLQDALDFYGQISKRLEDRFWQEFSNAVKEINKDPDRFHIDSYTGFKRYNFKKFPYNILFLPKPNIIRVQVLRHNKRNETFGSYRKQC